MNTNLVVQLLHNNVDSWEQTAKYNFVVVIIKWHFIAARQAVKCIKSVSNSCVCVHNHVTIDTHQLERQE